MNVQARCTRKAWIACAFVLALLVLPSSAFAVDNTGTGDVAGDPTAITDSNIFQLNSTTLALVKRAFDMADNPIPSGSSIPKGTQFKFMIYINNNTPVAVSDISMQDVIDGAGFAYSTGTAKLDNTVANCALVACTPVEELSIFQTVDATAALTDGADGDALSYNVGTTTIDVGDENEPANSSVSIAANSVIALSFTVTMQ